MKYHTFTVDKDYKYVYKFLKDNSLSERYLTFLRKEMGYIKINGKPVNIKAPLFAGDKLEIVADNNHKSAIKKCILPLNIVYEDEYYLLVNKPAGLTTIPTRSHYNINLSGAVASYLSPKTDNLTLRVVNRLDKDTAGIVMFAKNLMASNALKDTQKTYYALCKGQINEKLTIDKPIATIIENGINQRKRVISADGKPAITYVTPIEEYNGYTLVKLNLVHGRTHQIRVHLSSIGHPLLGDTLYGNANTRITHTALVCKQFTFFHSFLKKPISLEIEFPNDFKKLINES